MIKYITIFFFSILSIACSTTVSQTVEQQLAQPISCEAIDMEQSVIATTPYIKGMTCINVSKSPMTYEKKLSRSLKEQQFSGQVTVSGILHAYWSARINMQTNKGEKVLNLIFYPSSDQMNQSKFPEFQIDSKSQIILMIPIYSLTDLSNSTGNERFNSNITKTLLAQIKKESSINTDKFITYQEGHIEQRVLMTINNFSARATSCNTYQFNAQLVEFKADPIYSADNSNVDLHNIIAQQTKDSTCVSNDEPYDYSNPYEVKVPKNRTANIMSEPNSKSEVLTTLENGEIVKSIETVNDTWIHVIFDKDYTGAEQIEGYMLRKQLELAY